MSLFKIYINRFLHLFEVMRVPTSDKTVFLTFDDGPEDGITEFVISCLDEYGFKATFFCKGENALNNKGLYDLLTESGQSIGNHTFSHINGFESDTKAYLSDVKKADQVLNTHLFRPPWGSVTLSQFVRLRMRYRIVYWSLMSGDTLFDKLDVNTNLERLKKSTRKGDVVLFHCCKKHEKETRLILPSYLDWLYENGFQSKGL